MGKVWNYGIWNEDRDAYDIKRSFDDVENFYSLLRDSEKSRIDINGVTLSYRENQHKFSRDIMRAIRDKQILLVQAGVGIGKSMGYLIPVFSTYKNSKKFENIVISTSSIGLQHQLLVDIHNISKMLGIEINACIAKGINNYLCLSKLKDAIDLYPEYKDKFKELEKDIKLKKTIDRDELIEVGKDIWKKVQLSNRGSCSHCLYSKSCLYKDVIKDINKASIIITNHGHFAKSVLEDRDFIQRADMFIFDEAHKLEDNIRNIDSGSIDIDRVYDAFDYYQYNNYITSYDVEKIVNDTIDVLEELFYDFKRRSEGFYFRNRQDAGDVEITEYEKIPFYVGKLDNKLKKSINGLSYLINYFRELNYRNNIKNDKNLSTLIELKKVLEDMGKGSRSKNIYWTDFLTRNRFVIGYARRNTADVTNSIFSKNVPIICTSGSMIDSNKSYDYFKRGISLNNVKYKDRIVEKVPYASPFDYDKKSIFYYDTKIANPRTNHRDYLIELPSKISEIIHITNGRCLVLFTSKSDMEYVYNNINKDEFDFEIFMQGQASNFQMLNKFQKDVKSCLFATGAFWEGIDIAGKSLSNVIITRLPFANVDAITDNKARRAGTDNAFRAIYLNDMVQKISQGTGRLIRKKNDKGIICCLDPRCVYYIKDIKNATPFTRFTDDINDVIDFSNKYIVNMDGPRGHYKKKIKDNI